MRYRPRLILLYLVAAAGVLTLVAAGLVASFTTGLLPLDHVTVTRLEPQAVGAFNPGADPLDLTIGVTWTKDGWCSGQFTVQATETPTEVHVGSVTSYEHTTGYCAGLGTVDQMAWAYTRLNAPLGDRAVIRDSDGARLPVR
jgi:hypothetical protein